MANTLFFNKTPGREQVQVLYISNHFGCSWHCRAIIKLQFYANTRKEEVKQKARGQKLENSTANQTQSMVNINGSANQALWKLA